MRRLLDVLVAVLLSGLGVLLLGSALLTDRSTGSRLLLAVLGVFLLAVDSVVAMVRLARPDAAARTSLRDGPDGPSLVVGLRPTTPRVTVVVGLAGTLLFAAAVLGVGVTGGGLLFLPLVLVFAVLVPVGLRALGGDPRLEISARGVTYHGWSVSARLAWEDVVAVALQPGYRPRLLVSGRPDAPSWTVSSHRFPLPLEPTPRHPQIAVLALALDRPQQVARLLESYRTLDGATRAGLIGPEGVRYLAGPFDDLAAP